MANPMPPMDERVQQIIFEARLTSADLEVFWNAFQNMDAAATGSINQDQFHALINDEELLFFFGMCLFDIVGARNYKALTFSDFAYGLITFSLFGTEELLRFSFNCFDPERKGTIDLSDFNMMSRLLHARSSIMHSITALGSNVETVMKRMDTWVQDDLRIDYDEFIETNKMYPWILKPAEKLRRKIRNVSFGDDWWRDRITMLHWERQARMELLHGAEARKNRWEASRENRADVRKIRRRMGNPFFYLCPLFRPIFAHPCWDPKRKVSKLRNDAIKQRLETRYAQAEKEVAQVEEVKHVPKTEQPRVEQKMDAREERKLARRAAKGQGGAGEVPRSERALRNKERAAEKNGTEKPADRRKREKAEAKAAKKEKDAAKKKAPLKKGRKQRGGGGAA